MEIWNQPRTDEYSTEIWTRDRDSIEIELRLAQQNLGVTLRLSGPGEFQNMAARVVGEVHILARFDDARLNDIMSARGTGLEGEKRTRQMAASAHIDEERRHSRDNASPALVTSNHEPRTQEGEVDNQKRGPEDGGQLTGSDQRAVEYGYGPFYP